jgi:flavin reductase (DIM6/NTAB) family NADH-FMN oxidoreductase RutF
MTSSLEATQTDPLALRKAFSYFPSGVTAVCALVSGEPRCIIASTFTPVSLAPSLVSVCLQRTSRTWPTMCGLHRIGVSVLSEGQDAVCRSLSSKIEDRFTNVDWESDEDGSVYIHGASLWLNCSRYAELPGGDHTIVLLQIHGLAVESDRAPLVFHGSQFRRLAVS